VELTAGILAVVSVVRIWTHPWEPRAGLTLLALVATLPLLLRHRFPLAAPLVALAAGCLPLTVVLPGALWEQLQFFFGALLCAWVLGSGNDWPRAAGGLVVAELVGVASVSTDRGHSGAGDYVFAVTIVAAAWIGGRLFGVRAGQAAAAERTAERLVQEREQRIAAVLAEERARLARELHDVIAHSVGVMVVQAGAAEQVLGPENEPARQAMHAVRDSGKAALGELRRLLGLLRDDGPATPEEPQPSLGRLGDLVASVSATPTVVQLVVTGEPRPLPPGVDQAGYRIVQEALTNAMKHADSARVRVVVRWQREAVELEVDDDGGRRRAKQGSDLADVGAGRGLIGMRERARLYGGELTAGPSPGGGFRVTARLPT
jgi:signal transduction histidine kinase